MSPKDKFESDWLCEFSKTVLDDDKISIQVDYMPDGGNDNLWTAKITSPDQLGGTYYTTEFSDNSTNAENQIEQIIADLIANIKPNMNTGWSAMWLRLGNFTKGSAKQETIDVDDILPEEDDPYKVSLFDYVNFESSPDGSGAAAFEIIIEGRKSDDPQVYSRTFSAWQPNDITLDLTKTITSGYSSSLSSIPIYDLSGVEFEVWTSSSGGTNLGSITINSGTGSNTLTIPAEYANKTLYIKEVLPSGVIGYGYSKYKGNEYEIGDRIPVIMGDAGETTYVAIENIPLNDPVSIQIKKESNIAEAYWVIKPDLSGIEYTLEYYTSKSAATSGSSAYRTWKFETDSNGEINCRTDTPTSGTPFTANGARIYPIGWYRFYESTPSSTLQDKGLEKCLDIYYIEVADDGSGDGVSTVYTDANFTNVAGNVRGNGLNQPSIYQKIPATPEYQVIEQEHWEPFAFIKKDINLSSGPQGDAELDDAIFTVYCEDTNKFKGTTITYDGNDYKMSGNTVYVNNAPLTITIVDGKGICKYPLPKTGDSGRFYIKETTAPTGYKENSNTYYVDFQNRKNIGISLSVKNMETGNNETKSSIYTTIIGDETGVVKNTPRSGSIEIEKYDAESDDRKEQGDGSLQGIQFAIVNRSAHTVYYNGKTAAKDCVAYIESE